MRYIVAALAAGLLLGSAAFAADPPPVKVITLYESGPVTLGSGPTVVALQPVADPPAKVGLADPVKYPAPATLFPPATCTGPNCQPGATCPGGCSNCTVGTCTSGQCGMTGCGQCGATGGCSSGRWHLGDRIRERRAARRGG